VLINNQNNILEYGYMLLDENLLLIENGKIIMIIIDIIRAITPPNLLGILRRIAYANKKYHSGWMWGGVTRGLAGMKFSGSLRLYGKIMIIVKNIIIIDNKPRMSFHVKYGWNMILSIFIVKPIGFKDPVSCKNNMWIIINNSNKNGNKKCKEKKRVKVALSTENPPHIQ